MYHLLSVSFSILEYVKLFVNCLRREAFKDVPGGFPKSDLLGVTVALIHVAGQRFLAV